ncbi:hypothetical protein [Piscirickettsia salmonis]|nr:hypothetical protein [Piscirickettsia salmonis]
MLGDFASLDVQNTYRGSDAYVVFQILLMSNSRQLSSDFLCINMD